MRFFILVTAIICGMGLPVQAADNDPVITINPDGSVVVEAEAPENVIISPIEMMEKTPQAVPPPESEQNIVKSSPPPLPGIKPVRQARKEEAFPAVKESIGNAYIYEESPRQPGPVSSDEALRVALDVAPPSRGTQVYPADFNGLKVYQVVFKTEDGEQYVLVDRQTGEIIDERKSKKKKKM